MTDLLAGLALWQLVLIFGAAATVLVLAGIALVRYGDEIATRTGLGGLLIGALLLSVATSLPEIVADVSAAAAGAPDLAVSDLFGSSMANMAIFALLDLTGRRTVWPTVDLGHARVASMALMLTLVALFAISTPTTGHLGWVGLDTLAIFALYVASVAWLRRSRAGAEAPATAADTGIAVPTGWSEALEEPTVGSPPATASVRPAAIGFAVAAAVIFVSAPTTALSAKEIATEAGIGEGFVGVALLAVATSLPELVAALAAARIGAYDLAVGNLFGSNAFNMSVLVWADLSFTEGPILSAVDPGVQLVAGLGAAFLMVAALAAIVHGQETRIRRLEPDAVLVLLAYVGLVAAVYVVSR